MEKRYAAVVILLDEPFIHKKGEISPKLVISQISGKPYLGLPTLLEPQDVGYYLDGVPSTVHLDSLGQALRFVLLSRLLLALHTVIRCQMNTT